MPKTEKGRKVLKSMKDHYGSSKGESVYHASRKAGTIKGVEKKAGKGRKR